MRADTLAALKSSIDKWTRIANGERISPYSDTCALCKLFDPEDSIDCTSHEELCPVYEKTGFPACFNSPWSVIGRVILNKEYRLKRKFVLSVLAYRDPEFLAAAAKERDFLISLLPEGETP